MFVLKISGIQIILRFVLLDLIQFKLDFLTFYLNYEI